MLGQKVTPTYLTQVLLKIVIYLLRFLIIASMSSARLLESLAGASAATVSATGAGAASTTGAGVAVSALGVGCATEGDESALCVAGAVFVTIMPAGL
jgi:hypothetical protein